MTQYSREQGIFLGSIFILSGYTFSCHPGHTLPLLGAPASWQSLDVIMYNSWLITLLCTWRRLKCDCGRECLRWQRWTGRTDKGILQEQVKKVWISTYSGTRRLNEQLTLAVQQVPLDCYILPCSWSSAINDQSNASSMSVKYHSLIDAPTCILKDSCQKSLAVNLNCITQ